MKKGKKEKGAFRGYVSENAELNERAKSAPVFRGSSPRGGM